MTHHQRKLAQICQLLALAKSTTFQKERESAHKMAKKLMEKHCIPELEVIAFRQSLEPKRPRPARPQPQSARVAIFGFDPFWGGPTITVNSSSDNVNVHSIHIQFG